MTKNHIRFNNYASHCQKRVTFDIPDVIEPGRDISEHRGVEIVTKESEPNEVVVNNNNSNDNDTDNRDHNNDLSGTIEDVLIAPDKTTTVKRIQFNPKGEIKTLRKGRLNHLA